MLNIFDHKGIENQRHWDSSSPQSKQLSSTTQLKTNAGKFVGGKEHLYTVGGNVN
jgi:hypothetical protein